MTSQPHRSDFAAAARDAAPGLHEIWREHTARMAAEDAAKAAAARPAAARAAPAPHLDLPEDFDVAAAIESSLQPSRRGDGWTPQRQHDFLGLIATGATIESAARAQGLSASSAYGFRNSAKGAAFAIGWTAAQLLQRQRLADTVAARAFDGQTVTVTRPDGSVHERHFHDNRLAMSVLARLDRLAAGQIAAGTPDTTGEGRAARLAAAEFDRYLDVLAEGGGPARAGLSLAARAADPAAAGIPELAALSALARADLYGRTGAGTLAELDCADLDPAARAGWTASDWARAEAAGLVVLAPAPPSADATGVTPDSQHSDLADDEGPAAWWDEDAEEYRTGLPLPDGDDGLLIDEHGDYGDEDYQRSLTEEERAAVEAVDALQDVVLRADGLARRAAWLEGLRAAVAAAQAAAAASVEAGDPAAPVPGTPGGDDAAAPPLRGDDADAI